MSDDQEIIRRSVTVSGRVQGVGFRWSARTEARRLDVTGFVTNRPDSTVYAEAEGETDAVESFVEWLHHGPPGAAVDSVETSDLEPTGDAGFDIR